jgi:F0F1-type ATP synthase delta subunit
MKKSMRGIARTLINELEGKTAKDIDKHMAEAVTYLASKGLLGRWRDLERELNEAWREKYGASKITIASAHPLTAQALEKIEKLANGAEVQQVVDERLMGGALVRLDERRIDGTVLGSLTRLKQQLLS